MADDGDGGGGGGGSAKKPKRRKKHQAGVALGAAIVGFEHAVFRKLPPPHEVVAKARHDGPVAAADGTIFTLVIPGDAAEDEDTSQPG